MATKKRFGLTVLAVLLVLVLGALVALCMVLPKLLEKPAPTEPSTLATTTAAPTTEETEPTLPPPEANPYTFTDFQYDGRYRMCLAAPTMVGIDVSAHQQDIDWHAVAASGVKYVMLRVGYRGYETGLVNLDEKVQENYLGAKEAGLLVGAYFFSQALSVEEAQAEAAFTLEQIADWEVDMPVVFDWEQKKEGRTLGLSSRIVTDCAKVFCDAVEAAGYTPMVYFNPHHARNFFHLEELVDYPFWLAYYTDRMQYSYKVQMWQYTNTGSVPGIDTDVDINICFIEE